MWWMELQAVQSPRKAQWVVHNALRFSLFSMQNTQHTFAHPFFLSVSFAYLHYWNLAHCTRFQFFFLRTGIVLSSLCCTLHDCVHSTLSIAKKLGDWRIVFNSTHSLFIYKWLDSLSYHRWWGNIFLQNNEWDRYNLFLSQIKSQWPGMAIISRVGWWWDTSRRLGDGLSGKALAAYMWKVELGCLTFMDAGWHGGQPEIPGLRRQRQWFLEQAG